MIGGEILLYAALVCELIAGIVLFLYDAKKCKTDSAQIRTAARLGMLFISASLAMMIYYFIQDNFSVLYVWQYCASDMPLLYKIVAVFAGQQGTYLLWAWASLLFVWFIIEDYGFKNPLLVKTELIAMVLATFILLLCIKSEPFKPILDMVTHVPEEGNGLNPVFVTIWMVIHPFVTFIAYATTIVPASAATVHLITGEAGWDKISRQWLRISWATISICMVTGGLWAYDLVGWGGFWIWDPVQTATLVLWLLITANLHIIAKYREGKYYTTIAPVSTILLFTSTIYVTLITRHGIVHSLHDFPGTPTSGLLVFGLVAFSIVITVFGVRKFLQTDTMDRQKKSIDAAYHKGSALATIPKKSMFSQQNTFLWTNILLAVIIFVGVWCLTYSFISQHLFNTNIIIPPEFFNLWCAIPIMLLILLTGVCMLYGRVPDTYLKILLLLVFIASLLLALVPHHKLLDAESEFYISSSIFTQALGSISILSFVPTFIFTPLAILSKFLKDMVGMHGLIRLRALGIHLIHLGSVLVVLGVIVTTSFDIPSSVVYEVGELDIKKDIGDGWSMELTQFDVFQNPDGTWTQTAYLNIYKGGEPYCTGSTIFTRTNQYGDIHNPMIDKRLRRDVYVQFHGTRSHISTEAVVPLSIRIVPYISLLRAGCLLMVVGITGIVVSSYLLAMKKKTVTRTMKR